MTKNSSTKLNYESQFFIKEKFIRSKQKNYKIYNKDVFVIFLWKYLIHQEAYVSDVIINYDTFGRATFRLYLKNQVKY